MPPGCTFLGLRVRPRRPQTPPAEALSPLATILLVYAALSHGGSLVGPATEVGVLPAYPPTISTGWDVDLCGPTRFPCPACHAQTAVSPSGRSQARPQWRGPGALGKVFPEWWRSLPPSQDTVQIGNQLPGLKMRSLVVGGVSEDKVSVRRGFRGCMQVGQSLGTLASRLARAAHLWPLVHLLVFSERVVYAGAQPASAALFPAGAALPHGASSAPPAARHPVTVSHRQLRLHGVPRMQPLPLTPAPPSPPPT